MRLPSKKPRKKNKQTKNKIGCICGIEKRWQTFLTWILLLPVKEEDCFRFLTNTSNPITYRSEHSQVWRGISFVLRRCPLWKIWYLAIYCKDFLMVTVEVNNLISFSTTSSVKSHFRNARSGSSSLRRREHYLLGQKRMLPLNKSAPFQRDTSQRQRRYHLLLHYNQRNPLDFYATYLVRALLTIISPIEQTTEHQTDAWKTIPCIVTIYYCSSVKMVLLS